MAKFRRLGKDFEYICTTPVLRGQIIKVGGIYGVAITGGETGEIIAVSAEGVYECDKDAAEIALGTPVYLVNGKVTATKGSETVSLGTAWEKAVASANTVLVKIN